jgi:hypothetical protein
MPTTSIVFTAAKQHSGVIKAPGDTLTLDSAVADRYVVDGVARYVSRAALPADVLDLNAAQLAVLADLADNPPGSGLGLPTASANGQIAISNDASPDGWEARALAAADISDVVIANMTDGRFPYAEGGAIVDKTSAQVRAILRVSNQLVHNEQSPSNKGPYTICVDCPVAGTLSTVAHKLSSGTLTLAVHIDGVVVTGLSAISVTSTKGTATSTAANAVSAGSVISITVSSAASPVDLSIALAVT